MALDTDLARPDATPGPAGDVRRPAGAGRHRDLPGGSGRSDRHPLQRSVTGRWAAVVRENAHRPALGDPEGDLDYAEADRRTDRLARNVLAEDGDTGPLGLLTELSVQGLLALVGALRTGRPVVPLDPHLPAARLQVIAELARITSCLVAEGQRGTARALGPGVRPLPLEVLLGREPADDAAPLPHREGTDPAVVVFTSGSTGRPKGVVMTHDEMLDGADTSAERLGLNPADRVLLAMPLSFTAGTLVLGNALLNGASAWAYDPRDRGVGDLAAFTTGHGLTAFFGTPHLLRSLTASLGAEEDLGALRLAVTLGEAVHGRDVAAFRTHLAPGGVFANEAGSSEVGALCVFLVREDDPVPAGTVPGGVPTPSKEVRVLRGDGTPAAVGEPGEIVVTSHHLSGGYWNDPERTAAAFVAGPDGRRTYRTGDLGRLDADGNLHLLGRMDGAVKVRGYLVELSEVEGALLTLPSIAEACVVPVTTDGTTRLVAYVAHTADVLTASAATVRRHLRERLPEYMVPAAVVALPALPRTERGKVDRVNLPAVPARVPGEAPRGGAETTIAELWGRVLGLRDVGRDDDFWELGGDSLAVEEALALLAARFRTPLVTLDLVAAPTVAEMAQRLARGRRALPSHPTALTLCSGGTGTPVFCFAGAGGLAAAFHALAHELGDRPVHAFQAHGLESRALPDRSVDRAATRHLRVLRLLQPAGPYVLVGHSFGGLVALEVARRLRAAGEEVAMLTLLDTYLPASALPASAPDQAPATPGRRARAAVDGLRRALLPEGLPRREQLPVKALLPLAGLVAFTGRLQYDLFFDVGMRTSRRHRVEPYDGAATLVLARDNPAGRTVWDRVLTGPVEHRSLPCDHNSLLRAPHVHAVADLVRDAAARTDR